MSGVLKLRGVVPVIPTPFHPDESLDIASLGRLVDWIAGRGFPAMCLPAYGSEYYKLSTSERDLVVSTAVNANRGRIPIIAQANHASARVASELAARYGEMGADMIAVAIPRQFTASNADILDYCGCIASSASLPLLIQDFNPGKPTIGVDFVAELAAKYDNFQYVKLEDPMMADKVIAIRERMSDRIGILEGWGGQYMLEGIDAGIDGIMPGAAIADLLHLVFLNYSSLDRSKAHDMFGLLLPFINFALQDFETFLHLEKQTLTRRGLIKSATVRSLTRTPSAAVQAHAEFLVDQIERILKTVDLDV